MKDVLDFKDIKVDNVSAEVEKFIQEVKQTHSN
jgi:hypothetical protein